MKTDYFSIMAEQAHYSLMAAELLGNILNDYQPEQLNKWRSEMHRIENSADDVRHMAMSQLAKDFITPIERDDLLQLIQILDDVTDAIDEVVIELYMFNIRKLPAQAKQLMTVMSRCIGALAEAVIEFRHYKKSAELNRLLIEVNTMESEADAVYIEAVRALFEEESDSLSVMGAKAVYDSLESCCDLCEHAADVIESAVMNNT